MANEFDILLKVFLTIDYVKLCVDHSNPTGDGVPLDIVTMPDFVVDVDGAIIKILGESSEKAPSGLFATAEVGSRAGRVLSILAHLRDLDDEGVQLHYVAKTGTEGGAVLKRRLQQDLREQNLQPLRFPLVTPGSQTRYALLGRDSLSDHNAHRQISPLTENDVLTLDELSRHFYSPITTIQNARGIFFATDTLAQFEALIDIAIFGQAEPSSVASHAEALATPEMRHVFVDLSAVTDAPRDVIDLFKGKTESYRKQNRWMEPLGLRTALSVMVSRNALEANPQEYFEYLGLRAGKDILILYHENLLEIHDGGTSRTPPLPWSKDRPGSRDAFVAGYILFRAVASAWNAISTLRTHVHEATQEWPETILPNPYTPSGEKNPWPLEEALLFASTTARFWGNHSSTRSIPNKWLLLASAASDQRPCCDRGAFGDFPNSGHDVAEWIRSFADRACRLLAGEDDDVLLFNLRNFTSKSDLSIRPARWPSETKALCVKPIKTVMVLMALRVLTLVALRKRNSINPASNSPDTESGNTETKAYLTDLDGTLVHSSTFRKLCLRRAFLSMDWNDRSGSVATSHFPILPKNLAAWGADNTHLTMEIFLDRCVQLYDAVVYRNWEAWNAVLQNYIYYAYGARPKDFRQVWNHPLSYPVLLWRLCRILDKEGIDPSNLSPMDIFCKVASVPQATFDTTIQCVKENAFTISRDRLARLSKTLPREIVESLRPLVNTQFKSFGDFNNAIEKACEKWLHFPPQLLPGFIWASWLGEQKDDAVDSFHRELAALEAKYKRCIEAVTTQYWDVIYAPFRQTNETLRVLREVHGFRLYVATEGHHDTQVMKIKTVGLQDFFSESVILSTGAAAEPHEELRIVQEEIGERMLWLNVLDQSRRGTFARRGGSVITKEGLEQELAYLRKYEEAWMTFKDKSLGGIYCLILASIIVEPRSPLLALTNLRHLELNVEGAARSASGLRVTMMGDREKKDILPLLANWTMSASTAPVTTIRLLTLDHRKEGLPWEDKTAAKYVAWSPLQALLLMGNGDGQAPPLAYSALPPLILLRLATTNGQIEETMWNALVWGQRRSREKREAAIAFSLIAYLVIQSTVRDERTKLVELVTNLVSKMQNSRTDATIDSYRFSFTVLEELWRLVRFGGVAAKNDMAALIRDGICGEILSDISRYDASLERLAVDILGAIKGNCQRPTRGLSLIDGLHEQGLMHRLREYLNNWK